MSVTVDDDLVTDLTVPGSVVLLSGTTVDAELMFRVVAKQEMLLPDPFSGEKWEAPKGGEVQFIQDEVRDTCARLPAAGARPPPRARRAHIAAPPLTPRVTAAALRS